MNSVWSLFGGVASELVLASPGDTNRSADADAESSLGLATAPSLEIDGRGLRIEEDERASRSDERASGFARY